MKLAMRADAGVTSQRKKRGFTLTEIAIVLGIIGLILGAIWVAASSVYSNLRVSKTTNELLAIAQATRTLYATSPSTGESSAFVDETSNYISAGIFPTDMVNGTTVRDAWNGSVTVASQTITVTGDSLLIQFSNVPQSNCISLLTTNTGAGRDTGMTYAGAATSASTSSITTTSTFPITASTAATTCSSTSPNVVQFVFKLKG